MMYIRRNGNENKNYADKNKLQKMHRLNVQTVDSWRYTNQSSLVTQEMFHWQDLLTNVSSSASPNIFNAEYVVQKLDILNRYWNSECNILEQRKMFFWKNKLNDWLRSMFKSNNLYTKMILYISYNLVYPLTLGLRFSPRCISTRKVNA